MPSGSDSTCHPSSPRWPMSAGRAPAASRRVSSASWSRSVGLTSMCRRSLPALGSGEGSNTIVGCGPPNPVSGGPISMLPSTCSSSTKPSTSHQKDASRPGSRASITSSLILQAMPQGKGPLTDLAGRGNWLATPGQVPGRRSGRISGSGLAWGRVTAQRRFVGGLGADGLGADGLGADGLGADGFRASGAEDALGHADQPVGAVSYLLEPLQDLFDSVLQPVGRVPLGLRSVRTVVVPVRRARRLRPRGPRRERRPGRAVVLVVVVVTVVAGHAVVEVPSQFLGFVGRFLRLVGGLFGLVGLLLGAFSAVASLLGGGASFVGTPDGPGNRLVVAPFVGQLGRFLGQVGGFLRLICGLRRRVRPAPALARPGSARARRPAGPGRLAPGLGPRGRTFPRPRRVPWRAVAPSACSTAGAVPSATGAALSAARAVPSFQSSGAASRSSCTARRATL